MIPDDVRIGRLVPGPWLNAVLVGTTLVDAGVRWSWGPLSRFLSGHEVSEHLVSHAHGDHTGASARLCTTHRIPLLMGRRDAEAFTAGRIDTHGWAAVRLLARALDPPRHPVDRPLAEGDVVGPGFEVLEVPGHSPGTIALWRERDRTLVTGDGPVNVSADPRRPRFLRLPSGLDHDPAVARASRRRLGELGARTIVAVHGNVVTDAGAWRAAVEAG